MPKKPQLLSVSKWSMEEKVEFIIGKILDIKIDYEITLEPDLNWWAYIEADVLEGKDDLFYDFLRELRIGCYDDHQSIINYIEIPLEKRMNALITAYLINQSYNV